MTHSHRFLIVALLLTATACSSGPDQATGGPGTSLSPMTPTVTATPDPVINGRLQSLSEYSARARRACHACHVPDRASVNAFDTAAGRAFFWWGKGFTALTVVGADGERTRITCGDAFACPRGRRGSGESIMPGPGLDEFTVWGPTYDRVRSRADQEVRVIGLNGAVRRSINLTDHLPRNARVVFLAWSPDGTRLAVTTRPARGRARVSTGISRPDGRFNRIWLVHDGGRAQLVHTAARYSGPVPKRFGTADMLGHISYPSWSPDGSRLGFGEFYGPTSRAGMLTWYSFATRSFSLLLPTPGQDEPGIPTVLHEYRGYPGSANKNVVWSPDGTRLAFRTWRRVFELSTEDGRVVARHPIRGEGLVWPRRQS